MFSKKQWTIFISLVLISQEDYKWHGYQIKKHIKDVYKVDNDNVFPVLRELINEEYVEYKEIIDDANRVRKHYKITQKGENLLEQFELHNKKVSAILAVRKHSKRGLFDE